ncbi:AraC family transcriptional regulator [Microbaculum marinum]|uniref:AraC family transcriptional regulator ligand-binding domain-containing protein n=1 Tax=Microbaculum marinum TaxID=1764581 RepID=A0AAW9S130_9HYPH
MQHRKVPVISVTALAGVPDFVRSLYGEPTLRRANTAVKLDLEAIGDPDAFMPLAVLSRFVHAIERHARQPDFGLLVAPHLSIRNYGCWGSYLLGADTLAGVIERAIRASRFHSSDESVRLDVANGVARISYPSAAKGQKGYPHIACGVVGILLSICREYLPAHWRPLRVELDFPMPNRPSEYEEQFKCPVWFDAAAPAVCIDAHQLSLSKNRSDTRRLLTLSDVAGSRERLRDPDFSAIVAEQVRHQLVAGGGTVDSVARTLDLSVRSLQRELHRCGASFRDITSTVRTRRAAELLRETDVSITQISADLGYSAPAHFARAFRKVTGRSPRDYRMSFRQQSEDRQQTPPGTNP